VRNFRCVLRLELDLRCGHEGFSPQSELPF
jgi:hypothetical protein